MMFQGNEEPPGQEKEYLKCQCQVMFNVFYTVTLLYSKLAIKQDSCRLIDPSNANDRSGVSV